ncbi:MAG: hypothetical protein WDO73_37835 [Ignavibacteriota bacterium]
MNDLQEQQGCRVLPVEEALRYATGLAELIRHMHRDGTVCGRLDPKDFVWDNETVTLQRTDDASSGAYLAPEQIRWRSGRRPQRYLCVRSDSVRNAVGQPSLSGTGPGRFETANLEYTPPAIDGLPKGIASLIKSCLEKDRDLRLQRMNPVLIELKLAHASAQQAQASSDWRDKVVSLRSQVAAHEERLVGQQTSHAPHSRSCGNPFSGSKLRWRRLTRRLRACKRVRS